MNKLPIYYQASIQTEELLEQSLTLQEITHDWFKKELPNPPKFNLTVSDEHLLFYIKCNYRPTYDPKLINGSFVPALWEMDVAEFFLKEDGTQKYQEFNLAPSGAWWSGLFSGYRKEDEVNFNKPLYVKSESKVTESSWEAALLLKREELLVDIKFSESSMANVCFITGNQKNRIYISAGHLSDEKPDFHLAQNYPTTKKI